MKPGLRIGLTGETRFVVESRHAIDFAKDGMPPVLSTPWLVWYLEHAARQAVLELLEPGESTVGVEVNVQHLAATPPGQQVTCTARVFHVDRRLVSFSLQAHDERELIARGTHKLHVIQIERFAARLHAKQT